MAASKKRVGLTPANPLKDDKVPNMGNKSIQMSLYRKAHPLNPKQMAFLRHRMNEAGSTNPAALAKPVAKPASIPSPNLGTINKPIITTPVMTEQAKVNALKKFLKRSV